MERVSNARQRQLSWKKSKYKNGELRNGPNRSWKKADSMLKEMRGSFTHTACPMKLLVVSFGHSGMASLSATSTMQSHLTFYINFTKEYSSIWSGGARGFSVHKSWTVPF